MEAKGAVASRAHECQVTIATDASCAISAHSLMTSRTRSLGRDFAGVFVIVARNEHESKNCAEHARHVVHSLQEENLTAHVFTNRIIGAFPRATCKYADNFALAHSFALALWTHAVRDTAKRTLGKLVLADADGTSKGLYFEINVVTSGGNGLLAHDNSPALILVAASLLRQLVHQTAADFSYNGPCEIKIRLAQVGVGADGECAPPIEPESVLVTGAPAATSQCFRVVRPDCAAILTDIEVVNTRNESFGTVSVVTDMATRALVHLATSVCAREKHAKENCMPTQLQSLVAKDANERVRELFGGDPSDTHKVPALDLFVEPRAMRAQLEQSGAQIRVIDGYLPVLFSESFEPQWAIAHGMCGWQNQSILQLPRGGTAAVLNYLCAAHAADSKRADAQPTDLFSDDRLPATNIPVDTPAYGSDLADAYALFSQSKFRQCLVKKLQARHCAETKVPVHLLLYRCMESCGVLPTNYCHANTVELAALTHAGTAL